MEAHFLKASIDTDILYKVYAGVDSISSTVNISIPYRVSKVSTPLERSIPNICSSFLFGYLHLHTESCLGYLEKNLRLYLTLNSFEGYNKEGDFCPGLVAIRTKITLLKNPLPCEAVNFMSSLLHKTDIRSLLDDFIFYTGQLLPESVTEEVETQLHQYKEDKLFELLEQETYGFEEEIFGEAA